MTLVDAFFAGIALAFVVVVWAMHPSIGADTRGNKSNPQDELGASEGGWRR